MEKRASTATPLLSRRAILAGGLAVAGAAVGAKLVRDLRPDRSAHSLERQEESFIDEAEFSEPHPSEPWESFSTVHQNEQADRQELSRFRENLVAFQHLFQGRFGNTDTGSGGSFDAQSQARAFLLQTDLPEQISHIAMILIRYPSTRGGEADMIYNRALQAFSSCHCQGLVYAALQKAARQHGGKVSFARYGGQYHASRLRDYIPTSDDIWSQDIDPRNWPHIPASTRQNIERSPVWSGKKHKQIFRRFAERISIIEQAQQEDLTIVEYFSLIKSIIHERAVLTPDQRTQESIDETVERLLEARRRMFERKVLSVQTEKVILFYGNDQRYMNGADDTGWNDVIEAVGLSEDRIERIGTSETRSNAVEERSKLKNAIISSRGKTFLAFKTHGANTSLVIDQSRGPENISDRFLAEALFSRLQATRNPRTLAEMDIVIDACNSYTFTKNVVRILRELWESSSFRALPFSRVHLPFIVTAVQEGANGQAGSMISSRLDLQFSGIQEEGAVYGRRLLQNVQPIIYEESDMTFFAAETGTEFSRRSITEEYQSV